jgi:hypothetical protein
MDSFYDDIDNISNKQPSELIAAMKDSGNILKYYGFLIKEEKITVQLKTPKENNILYEINIKDPLILLRFYYQARNTEAIEQNFDLMELYLTDKDGGSRLVHPTDTIASLKGETSLGNNGDDNFYFSFKIPEEKKVSKGGKKRKRKKKKKAFPSRKKNNRKNRTKKKTLSK